MKENAIQNTAGSSNDCKHGAWIVTRNRKATCICNDLFGLTTNGSCVCYMFTALAVSSVIKNGIDWIIGMEKMEGECQEDVKYLRREVMWVTRGVQGFNPFSSTNGQGQLLNSFHFNGRCWGFHHSCVQKLRFMKPHHMTFWRSDWSSVQDSTF